ncbi:MAG TPA: hypothetical protein VFT53_00385 [Candidatus Saccharimonadales bacterium]|nr:hypothetical protein [Candidatus Saccharimonadales bacterium]
MLNITLVKLSDTKMHDKSNPATRLTKIVHEYNSAAHPLEAVDVALTTVSGTYPATGWAANEVCSMIYYILHGTAVLTSEDGQTFALEPRDALLLLPKTWYTITGDFEALMVCAPAWYKEQSRSKA